VLHRKINRKLKNISYRFGHVTLLEIDTERKFYTRHGLHLNKKGKDGLARSIANLIKKLILNEDKGKQGITLDWKGVINGSAIALNSIQESDDKISNRTSMRKKNLLLQEKMVFLAKSVTNNKVLSAYTKSQEDIYDDYQNLCSKLNYNSDDISLVRKYSNNRQDKGVDIVDSLRVFHQNIRGLKGKTDELDLHLLDVTPHIICLTEHHLKDHEIDIMSIPQYKLGQNTVG
jgi:hypothetical protein